MVGLNDGADLGLGGDGGCSRGRGDRGDGYGRIKHVVGVVMVGESVIESVELFGEVGKCLEGDGFGAVRAVLVYSRAGVA